MTTATVKYIQNGYIVTGAQFPPSVPQPLYALTVPEVVYWLGRIFDPIVLQGTLQMHLTRFLAEAAGIQELLDNSVSLPAPQVIVTTDPLLGQLANVETVASGGFLVTQIPHFPGAAQQVDIFCATMDQVSDVLTLIYTPPPVGT